MTFISKASILFFISIFIHYIFANGFTTDLIHRDSTLSPYYDPSISRFERLNNAFIRSFSRASITFANTMILASSGGIGTIIQSNGGSYLMKVSIGTPAIETLAIADTGSDLAWIQCKPCTDCYDQKSPIFDPTHSSSYRNIVCESEQCNAILSKSCVENNICQYEMNYGDRSFSIGYLAAETFTFNSSSSKSLVAIPKVVFGCGHVNRGTFRAPEAGIIGLGGGSLSVVKQLDSFIQGKFSYCLVPIDSSTNVTSKLKFGSDALVSGPQVVSTPLISKVSEPTFYYLNLEGISVGDKRLAYMNTNVSKSKASTTEKGNIIIDSGTTLTLLPMEVYLGVETELEKSIKGKRVKDPEGILSLCYEVDGNIKFPKITFHFTDADIELKSTNIFVEVKTGIVCLSLVPADDVAIFGNLAQMDYLIGYDLFAKKVSFMPTDCTKQ